MIWQAYSGQTFAVFLGEPPVIIPDDQKEKFDPSKLYEIPIEYLKSFKENIVSSLRDFAGISIKRER